MHQKPDIPFPRPIYIAGRRFWPNGVLRRYIAEVAGLGPPESRPDDEVMKNSRQVRDLFGGVSDMWIERRLKHATESDAPQAA